LEKTMRTTVEDVLGIETPEGFSRRQLLQGIGVAQLGELAVVARLVDEPAPAIGLADLCTDAGGRCHGMAIAPPLIRSDVIAGIKHTARELVAPQIADIFGRCVQPFFQPIYDMESPQIVFGRVALLGDAAFVARPHVGAGVTKAALDAQSLAGALRAAMENPDAGLARYQREQRSFGSALVALSREEGAYLSAQLKPREQRTGDELHRDVESVVYTHNARNAKIQRLVANRSAGV
jgi:hypothetical protein